MAIAENDVIDNEVDQDKSVNQNPDEQSEQGGETDADEVVVTIGDEKADEDDGVEEEEVQRAPEWVKNLRKSKRDLEKSKREQERKLREQAEEIDRLKSGSKPAATVLGEKPTLESCDYDSEKFEQSLTDWHDRKRKVEQDVEAKRAVEEAEQQDWQGRLNAYTKGKAELKIKDFDEAEAVVKDTLSVVQQGIIVKGAENSALVVAALGKNPKKAQELAAITDPVKFAFAVSKLEAQLKVTTRRTAPPPETVVRGSAPISGSVDSTLERLRAEADKTGNYSKVTQYKKQQREKQRA